MARTPRRLFQGDIQARKIKGRIEPRRSSCHAAARGRLAAGRARRWRGRPVIRSRLCTVRQSRGRPAGSAVRPRLVVSAIESRPGGAVRRGVRARPGVTRCTSCRTCAMNSTSMPPPGRSLTSQEPVPGQFAQPEGGAYSTASARVASGCGRAGDGLGDRSGRTGADRRAAGHDAGPGEGHALPGPCLGGVVGGEAGERDGDGALVARGAEARVDLVERALAAAAR